MSVVVITGASSGIGRAAAIAWAKRGAKLVLSARGESALEEVAREVTAAGGQAVIEAGDVTVEADRVRLVERAESAFGAIDVLVNNAGRGYYAAVREIDPGELEALFALNVVAPLRLAQLALPARERGRGTIVMVSSIAGIVSSPRMGAYAASKFALEAIAIALRAENAARGVRVVVVRPGPVDTPFREHSIAKGGGAGVRPPGAKVQAPEEVAGQMVTAVARGRAVVETTAFVKGAAMVARVAPGVYRRVAARMAAKEGALALRPDARLDRPRVPFEPLESGEGRDRVGLAREPRQRIAEHRRPGHEVVHAERRAEAHRSAGGQDVRRSGEVVPRGLRGGGADEDRAGRVDVGDHRPGVGHLEAHVLRGDRVGHLREPRARRGDDRDPVRLHRRPRDRDARERLERLLDLPRHGLGEFRGRAEEQRIGRLVVLRLRQEIRGDDARVGRVVGDDEDLARPGDAVDVDRAVDEALGAGDVEVPGADDLVDARDRLRPVGERADRVGAPRVEDRRHAGEVRSRVDRIVRSVARERGREKDLLHACDRGGDRRHEDARRIASLPTGRVHPGARDGEDARAELAAVFVGEEERPPLVGALALVESADAGGGGLERGARGGREAREGLGAGEVAADEGGRAALVEALGESEDGGVSSGANRGEDRADVGLDAREVRLAAGAEPIERAARLGRAIDVDPERRHGHGRRRHRAGEGSSTRASVSLDA